jgi:hypothetical protein
VATTVMAGLVPIGAMRPRSPEGEPSDDLFRAQLSNQLDGKHPLVRLAGLIETLACISHTGKQWRLDRGSALSVTRRRRRASRDYCRGANL